MTGSEGVCHNGGTWQVKPRQAGGFGPAWQWKGSLAPQGRTGQKARSGTEAVIAG